MAYVRSLACLIVLMLILVPSASAGADDGEYYDCTDPVAYACADMEWNGDAVCTLAGDRTIDCSWWIDWWMEVWTQMTNPGSGHASVEVTIDLEYPANYSQGRGLIQLRPCDWSLLDDGCTTSGEHAEFWDFDRTLEEGDCAHISIHFSPRAYARPGPGFSYSNDPPDVDELYASDGMAVGWDDQICA